MQVVFRTDASLQIGTGHVVRCLTLADALRERDCECRFICREHPGNLLALIRQHGYAVHALPSFAEGNTGSVAANDGLAHAGWLGTDWQTDAEQTCAAIGDGPVDWLVVDHYALDDRWEQQLRPVCRKLMAIDDLADRPHDCDLLLDQNLVADWEQRYQGKVPAHCGLMLGPDHALLQPQYAELHGRVPPREGAVRRVLVYFGGADSDNLTGRSIAALLSLQRSDVVLDVVINPSSPHAEGIRRQVEEHPQIMLHTSLPSLAPLMVKADLAIGAGGTTSWERCCLGLPSVVITLAENQRSIAAELDRRGLIRWLGHKDEVNETDLAQALTAILHGGLPSSLSEQCSRTVDGRGAERVSAILSLDTHTPLRARLARLDDEALILGWANDPLARRNAVSLGSIGPATHRIWFRERLRDLDHCRIYVVETPDGLPVGQVCFERSGEMYEIDYALDPRARSRELGKALLQTVLLALRESTTGALQFGRVEDAHGRSRRVFEDLGFEFEIEKRAGLSIAVCSDAGSWINNSVPELILGWLTEGHSVAWAHSAGDLPGGDVCFYLSYGRIVDASTRSRYRHNLVVHASDLPKGRGWSPASWLILEGADCIPVTLLEAVDQVDAGPIYLQDRIDLDGTELVDDWRALLAEQTVNLARAFVANYPAVLETAREQAGEPSIYPRRRAKDSALDPEKKLAEQFNQLRIVDNEGYPAFFSHKGKEFVLKITRR